MFIYQRLLLMSFCRKGGNSLWSQTSNCSLFNGVACCILRWSIFIVCLIVYCFCLVILVNVDYTHYNSFYFWEGWIYLRVSYVKFWMMIFSMDIVWSKYIIFMHIFPRKWSSKNYDSVPHSQGLMNEVSEHFYHDIPENPKIVHNMYIVSEWDMSVYITSMA